MSKELAMMLDAAMGRYRAADAAADADGRAQAHRDMTEIVAAMRIDRALEAKCSCRKCDRKRREACDDTAALCGVAGVGGAVVSKRVPGGCDVCDDDGCELCMHAKAAELRRLRKLFDDAGQGEHNVLALIDHYQDVAAADEARAHHAEAELRRLTTLRPISELTDKHGAVLCWPFLHGELVCDPVIGRYPSIDDLLDDEQYDEDSDWLWSPLPSARCRARPGGRRSAAADEAEEQKP